MLTRAPHTYPIRTARLLGPCRVASPWHASPPLTTSLRHTRRASSRLPAINSTSFRRPTRASSPDPQWKSRQLATAVDTFEPGRGDSYIPFEGLPSAQSINNSQNGASFDPSLASLRKFDPRNIVVMPLAVPRTKPTFRASHGIPGEIIDLQQHLYACVQVGRFDRAAALVRRLSDLLEPDAPEIHDAHHRYLSGMLDLVMRTRSNQHVITMQKWFELDIRARQIPIDDRILSVLLKASLYTLTGARLDRTIRRYMNQAQELGPDVYHDTLSSGLLSDQEADKILELFPDEFMQPQETSGAAVSGETGHFPDGDDLGRLSSSTPTELRQVEQKGLGLRSLQTSLHSLVSDDGATHDHTSEQQHLRMRQEKLEEDVLTSAIQRWRDESVITQEMRAKGQLSQPMLGSLVHEWINAMIPLLKKEIARAEELDKQPRKSDENDDLILASPFLKMLPPDQICAATILTFVGLSFDMSLRKANMVGSIPTRLLAMDIARKLEKELKSEQLQNHYLQHLSSLPLAKRKKRIAQLMRRNRSLNTSQLAETDGQPASGLELTAALKCRIGVTMLTLFMKAAKIPVSLTKGNSKTTEHQPVASHSWVWKNGKKIGVIQQNMELLNRLKREPVADLIAKPLPMIAEPADWTALRSGGYLKSSTSVVRLKDNSNSQREYLQLADQRGDLKQIYAGLDVISKTPWRINGQLFEVMTQVWNTGEGLAKFAPENPVAKYPPEPERSDVQAHQRWKGIIKAIDNEVTGFHSQRCYQNFQLEVAKAFLNDTFYCPHNIDFRGRAYPIPPYLNHMGSDTVRGLFQFAEGKELGENGLYWLKVHLANMYGFDKESLKQRELFTDSKLAEIYDSAENPLGGSRWWLDAEDPWQCLAACIDLKNALDSPVPAKYISHQPVQQDGSCNGLQHYAALGGDEIGARQVNLEPGERPADIYGAVAEMVKARIAEDVGKGDARAKILNGHITRKVVKQPVMTNVYGVTFHGAASQVRKQLVDILPKESLDNDINFGQLSKYVAQLIFQSLAEMFNGAHAIQTWLGECGSRITQALTPEQIQRTKARHDGTLMDRKAPKKHTLREPDMEREDHMYKSTIVWTTPLGLPVVQPYRQPKKQQIRTNLQRITLLMPTISDPVSKKKQLQAFPPNFIHSLDATHMMLSALKCNEIGLTFAAVHDSFWTHAGDIPTLNRVLRDAFVRVHAEDVVGRLREEFVARYRGCMHHACVKSDSPIGKKICEHLAKTQKSKKLGHFRRSAIRFKDQVTGLLEEAERQRLLHSEDVAEQQRGREMVTPASIFEADDDPEAGLVVQDNGISKLGELPLTLDEGALDAANERIVKHPQAEHDLEAEVEGSMEPAEVLDTNAETQSSGEQQTSASDEKNAKRRAKLNDHVYFWAPLTFPPAPQRGTFDVSRLKDSQYFFS